MIEIEIDEFGIERYTKEFVMGLAEKALKYRHGHIKGCPSLIDRFSPIGRKKCTCGYDEYILKLAEIMEGKE